MNRYRTRLRKYRRAAGLTQHAVARILNLRDKTALSRWERGQCLPSLPHVLALSSLYMRLVNDLVWPEYVAATLRIQRRRREHDRRKK